MPISKEPKPLPSSLDFTPAGSAPHKVTNDESWWTLADLPAVKAAGMSARDLCVYNFKTKNPSEINWYLYHKVGCRKGTRDGKNLTFTSADRPGIVYLPKPGPPPPAHEIVRTKPSALASAWFGLVAKAGTQFAVVGIETVSGVAV